MVILKQFFHIHWVLLVCHRNLLTTARFILSILFTRFWSTKFCHPPSHINSINSFITSTAFRQWWMSLAFTFSHVRNSVPSHCFRCSDIMDELDSIPVVTYWQWESWSMTFGILLVQEWTYKMVAWHLLHIILFSCIV